MKMTRRHALSLAAAAPSALRSFAAAAKAQRLYIGTYTTAAGSVVGGEGIYSATWEAGTGELTVPKLAAATPDPTFLAVCPRLPDRLYAVNELPGGRAGTVTAFTRNDRTGALRALNTVESGGEGPCHLSLDQTGQALFAANYPGGSISSHRVTAGGLGGVVSHPQFSGSGPKPEQTKPHGHCVRVSPDNRSLLVSDLGTDRIHLYHFDAGTAVLTPAATPSVSVAPGSGPRHTLFHPNGRWVYSLNELGSTVDLFAWDGAVAGLTHQATVSTLPPEARGTKNNTAELALSPDARFLYVSNRFHDSIAVFGVDGASGELTMVQDVPCGGKVPRSFTLDPTGAWLLVANQDTANVAVFRRDGQSGRLTGTGKSYAVNRPVCLLFA